VQVLSVLYKPPGASGAAVVPLPVESVDTAGMDTSLDYTKSRKIDRLQCQDIIEHIFQVPHLPSRTCTQRRTPIHFWISPAIYV
jgi:hypothetical protein